ncbi:MAG: hypothetical protein AMXMBFR56_52820 [Polyangiaceae bacterium]
MYLQETIAVMTTQAARQRSPAEHSPDEDGSGMDFGICASSSAHGSSSAAADAQLSSEQLGKSASSTVVSVSGCFGLLLAEDGGMAE